MKIYEFFGDSAQENVWKNELAMFDFGMKKSQKISEVFWDKNTKTQSRKVLFSLRLCALAFLFKKVYLLFDNYTSPVVNVWLDTVLNVAELGEELLRNRSWLLAKDVALASLDVVYT